MGKNKAMPRLPSGSVLVDSHCHLDMEDFVGDLDACIARAVDSGVTNMITIGIDRHSSEQAVEIASQHEAVYASVGVHPHHVAEATEDDYEVLAGLAKHGRVVAFGEIGLDYVKLYSPRELQLSHFERQLHLARELYLPVIIHDREAHEDILAILKGVGELPAGGVMHCFSGDLHLARKALDLGFFISLPGVLTFQNAQVLQGVARVLPLEHLLLETDAPYLTPAPMRGRRNEPSYVVSVAQRLAELRGITLAEVALATTRNARRLFALP